VAPGVVCVGVVLGALRRLSWVDWLAGCSSLDYTLHQTLNHKPAAPTWERRLAPPAAAAVLPRPARRYVRGDGGAAVDIALLVLHGVGEVQDLFVL
jgi:hypothetical protein